MSGEITMATPCEQEDTIKEIKKDVKEMRDQLTDGALRFNDNSHILNKILEQTQKTNGRVTKSENDIAEIKLAALEKKYTWKMVVKDVAVSIISVGGIVFALTRILGG